jgi:hypothetical protein
MCHGELGHDFKIHSERQFREELEDDVKANFNTKGIGRNLLEGSWRANDIRGTPRQTDQPSTADLGGAVESEVSVTRSMTWA